MLLILAIYGIKTFIGLNLEEVSIFFQFIFSGLILLAFISQTDLIFKNEIIIITRKLEPTKKKELETKIEKEIEAELDITPEPKPQPKPELEPKPEPEPQSEPNKEKPRKKKRLGKKKLNKSKL